MIFVGKQKNTIALSKTQPYSQALLTQLSDVSQKHPEIFSRECRKHLATALHKGLIEQEEGYHFPTHYGLSNNDANLAIRNALSHYLEHIIPITNELNINTPQNRLTLYNQHSSECLQKNISLSSFFGFWITAQKRNENKLLNLYLPDASEGEIELILFNPLTLAPPEGKIGKILDRKITHSQTALFLFINFLEPLFIIALFFTLFALFGAIVFFIIYWIFELSYHLSGAEQRLIFEKEEIHKLSAPLQQALTNERDGYQGGKGNRGRSKQVEASKYYTTNLTQTRIINHYKQQSIPLDWCCYKKARGERGEQPIYKWRKGEYILSLQFFDPPKERSQKRVNVFHLEIYWGKGPYKRKF